MVDDLQKGLSFGISLLIFFDTVILLLIYFIKDLAIFSPPKETDSIIFYDPVEKDSNIQAVDEFKKVVDDDDRPVSRDGLAWLNSMISYLFLHNEHNISLFLKNVISKQALDIFNQIHLDLPFPVEAMELVKVEIGSEEPAITAISTGTGGGAGGDLVLNAQVRSNMPIKITISVTLLADRKVSCEFSVLSFDGNAEILISSSSTTSLVSMTFSELPEIVLAFDCDIKSFSSVMEMVVHRIRVICTKMFVSPNRHSLLLDKKAEIMYDGGVCIARGGLQHGDKAGSISVKVKELITSDSVPDDDSFYYCCLFRDEDRPEAPFRDSLYVRLFLRRGRLAKDKEIGVSVVSFDQILFNKRKMLKIAVMKGGRETGRYLCLELYRYPEAIFPPLPFQIGFADCGLAMAQEDSIEFDKKTERTHHTRSNSSRNSSNKKNVLGSDYENIVGRREQPDVRFLGVTLHDAVQSLLAHWGTMELPKILSEKENLTFLYYEVGFVAKFLENEVIDLQAYLQSLYDNSGGSLSIIITQISSCDIQIRCIIERIKDLIGLMKKEGTSTFVLSEGEWENRLDIVSERLTNLVHIVCLIWKESVSSPNLDSAVGLASGSANGSRKFTFDSQSLFDYRSPACEATPVLTTPASEMEKDEKNAGKFHPIEALDSVGLAATLGRRHTSMGRNLKIIPRKHGEDEQQEQQQEMEGNLQNMLRDYGFVSPPAFMVENKSFSCKLFNMRGILTLTPTMLRFQFNGDLFKIGSSRRAKDNNAILTSEKMVGVCYRVSKSWEPFQRPVEKHLFQKWSKWYRFTLDNDAFCIRNPDDSLYRIKRIIGLSDLKRIECLIPVLNVSVMETEAEVLNKNLLSLPKAILSFFMNDGESSVFRFAMDIGTAQQVYDRIQSVLFVETWLGQMVVSSQGVLSNPSIEIGYDCLNDTSLSNHPVISNMNQGLPLIQQQSCIRIGVLPPGKREGVLVFSSFVGDQESNVDTINQFLTDKIEECCQSMTGNLKDEEVVEEEEDNLHDCLVSRNKEASSGTLRIGKGFSSRSLGIGTFGCRSDGSPFWESQTSICDLGGYRYLEQTQILDDTGKNLGPNVSPLYVHFRIHYPPNRTVHEYLCSFDANNSSQGVSFRAHNATLAGSLFLSPDYFCFASVAWPTSLSPVTLPASSGRPPKYLVVLPVDQIEGVSQASSSILRTKTVTVTMKTGSTFVFTNFKDGAASAHDCYDEMKLFSHVKREKEQ